MQTMLLKTELKFLLIGHYGEGIRFAPPVEANKSVMVFLDTCTAEEMANTIRASNPVRICAEMIRESLMNVDFGL